MAVFSSSLKVEVTLHPSEAEIRRYRERSLDASRLLALDDHLAECPECRSLLEALAAASFAVRSVRAEFKPPHLNFEQLEAYADGRLQDSGACDHLAMCSSCREEAEDLRRFASEYRPGSRNKPVWHYMLGTAAAAIAASAFLVIVPTRKPDTGPKVVAVAQVAKSTVPAEYASLVASVTAAGRIEVPSQIVALAGHKSQLRGTAEAVRFRILGPSGTAMASGHPEFRWEALPGARSYRVSVYDSDFNPMAVSPALIQTAWTCSTKLPQGRVYSWQVTASVAGGEVTAPRPPEPEARFTLLSDAESQRLEQVRQKSPEAHLVLGILFGQAGALDEAASELKQAIAKGDHPKDARRLLLTLPASGT